MAATSPTDLAWMRLGASSTILFPISDSPRPSTQPMSASMKRSKYSDLETAFEYIVAVLSVCGDTNS